jgi:hypothetical protein
MIVYDPRNHTFESWASLMCELFADLPLGMPTSEDDWQQWGAGFTGVSVFNAGAVPSPYLFDDWQEWAQRVVQTVNVVQ